MGSLDCAKQIRNARVVGHVHTSAFGARKASWILITSQSVCTFPRAPMLSYALTYITIPSTSRFKRYFGEHPKWTDLIVRVVEKVLLLWNGSKSSSVPISASTSNQVEFGKSPTEAFFSIRFFLPTDEKLKRLLKQRDEMRLESQALHVNFNEKYNKNSQKPMWRSTTCKKKVETRKTVEKEKALCSSH